MDEVILDDFLAADLDGAFAFARRLPEAGVPPSERFLADLKQELLKHAPADVEEEGSQEWAHVVAGLMIARDWDPDGFAGVAAYFIGCRGIAV